MLLATCRGLFKFMISNGDAEHFARCEIQLLAGSRGQKLIARQEDIWLWVKIGTQNGALPSGNVDQNLRSPVV